MAEEDRIPEPVARRILEQAMTEERCSEFLHCLWDGGSATVDLTTGRLVLVSGVALEGLG